MDRGNVISSKSMDFAVRAVKLYKVLSETKAERIMSKQLLRSATSIGANVHEAIQAQSKNDFVSKMSISLKEAAETEYWLELLYKTEYLSKKEYNSMMSDCEELMKLLVAILKTSKTNKPSKP